MHALKARLLVIGIVVRLGWQWGGEMRMTGLISERLRGWTTG